MIKVIFKKINMFIIIFAIITGFVFQPLLIHAEVQSTVVSQYSSHYCKYVYKFLGSSTGLYDADGIITKNSGTFSTSIKFPETFNGDYALFHTDDSRIVFYIDSNSHGQRIVARAIGNKPAFSDETHQTEYPEVSILMNDYDAPMNNSAHWYKHAKIEGGEWYSV